MILCQVLTLTVLVLAVVMLVISPPGREQGGLALVPLQSFQPALSSLAVAAVCGGHGADGVLHLAHLHLGRLLWPPRHRAGLRGQVDRRGLVSAIHLD